MVNIPAHFMGEFIIPFFVFEKRIYGVQKSELFKIGLTDKTSICFEIACCSVSYLSRGTCLVSVSQSPNLWLIWLNSSPLALLIADPQANCS